MTRHYLFGCLCTGALATVVLLAWHAFGPIGPVVLTLAVGIWVLANEWSFSGEPCRECGGPVAITGRLRGQCMRCERPVRILW